MFVKPYKNYYTRCIKMKTWIEAHEGEKFTDNSKIENCRQCKTCKHWNGGTDYSNDYQKSSCQIYVYPAMKPIKVIKNTAQCEYYTKTD
jgi:hypothetical protein